MGILATINRTHQKKRFIPVTLLVLLFLFPSAVSLSYSFGKTTSSTSPLLLRPDQNLGLTEETLENFAPQLTSVEKGKSFIVQASSTTEKNQVVEVVELGGGVVVNLLPHLPFLLASGSSELLSKIGSVYNVYEDSTFQSVPLPVDLHSLTAGEEVMQSYVPPIDLISGQSLFGANHRGQGVKIAILDTGIDGSHSDLTVAKAESFVLEEYGFSSSETDTEDGNGHGSHVAGIAAGTGEASKGAYVGVAPEAELYSYKVASQQGHSTVGAVLAGIDAAIEDEVDIISISLGMGSDSPTHPTSLAVDEAVGKYGIHVTVSAGNEGPGTNTVNTPGAARNVITVGAAYPNKSTTNFSSRGPAGDGRIDPDLTAPGYQIIAPLAKESITVYSEEYYSPSAVVDGSGSNDYIAFSGTSMSAPVVAGSIALLLSAHPNVSPMAMRAALMSSADVVPDEPEYMQGAGFINLEKADQLLTNSGSDVISFLPKNQLFPGNILLEPYEVIETTFQVVSGFSTDVMIGVSNATLGSMLGFSSPSISLNSTTAKDGYYGEFQVTLTIPGNPVPGLYTGELVLTVGGDETTINVGPFLVGTPKRQLSWELWYSDSADGPRSNYNDLRNSLLEEGIYLDASDDPLFSRRLEQYNTIVFPDNELSFSTEDIADLRDFVERGGNVVLIGSFYPFSNNDNLNLLATSFGVTLELERNIGVVDLGYRQGTHLLNESVELVSQAGLDFSAVDELKWGGGSHLSVSGDAKPLGILSDGTPVVAGFLGNTTHSGNLIVLGSEYWFYSGLFLGPEEAFSKVLFNYLAGTNQPFASLFSLTNSIKHGADYSFSVYAGPNDNSYISESTGLSISHKDPSDQVSPITMDKLAGTNGFNTTLTNLDVGWHSITVSFQSASFTHQFFVYQTVTNVTMEVTARDPPSTIPVYLEDYEDITAVQSGDVVDISVSSSISTSALTDVIVTLVPEVFSDLTSYYQDLSSIVSDKVKLTRSGQVWKGEFNILPDYPDGYYVAELKVDSDDIYTVGQLLGGFFVFTEDPEIDLSQSKVDDRSFDYYDIPEDSDPNFLDLSTGDELTFRVVPQSSDMKGLEAYVLFLPYFAFIDRREVIRIYKLDSMAGVFTGTLKLPDNTSQQAMSDSRTLNYGNGLLLIFYVLLRDENGNYGTALVLALMGSSLLQELNIDPVLVTFMFIILPGAIIAFYYFRNRNRKKEMRFPPYGGQGGMQWGQQRSYQQWQQNQPSQPPVQPSMRFCPECGHEVPIGSNFCMECGTKISNQDG